MREGHTPTTHHPPTPTPTLTPNPGHAQGSRYIYAENTIGAHKRAWGLGAHVLELDVRRTSDGHLVVFHDPDSSRVVGESGGRSVEGSTLAEVKAWDAGGGFSADGGRTRPLRGGGERVPTFAEFMDAFPDAHVNVEIKENDRRVADLVLAEFARWPGIERRVLVGGRYCGVMGYFRSLAGDRVATSACETEGLRHILFATAGLAVPYYRLVSPPPFKALQIPTVSGAFRLATAGTVELAHAFGIQVHFWVVNDEETMRHCLDIGADVLITDRTDLAVPLVEARGGTAGPGRTAERPDHFEPPHSPPEIHGCVTLTCRAFQMLNPTTLWAAYAAVVALVLWVVVPLLSAVARFLCCGRGGGETAKAKSS